VKERAENSGNILDIDERKEKLNPDRPV